MLTKLLTKTYTIGASIYIAYIATHVFLDQPNLDSSDFDYRASCSKNLNEDNDSMSTVSDELTIKTGNTSVTLKLPRGGDGKRHRLDTGGKAIGDARSDFYKKQNQKAARAPSGKRKSGSSYSLYAEGFVPDTSSRRRPPDGLGGRFGNKDQPDFSDCRRGPNSITVVSHEHRPEHQPDGYSAEQMAEFQKDPKFEKLAQDPQLAGQSCQTNAKSEEEACTILQAESEGKAFNLKRPNLAKGEPNYDFKGTDSKGSTIYYEVKCPRNGSLKDAARLGRKASLQQGNSGDVVIVVNLQRIPREMRDRYECVFREAANGPVTFINS